MMSLLYIRILCKATGISKRFCLRIPMGHTIYEFLWKCVVVGHKMNIILFFWKLLWELLQLKF